jgi:hypothetical protein
MVTYVTDFCEFLHAFITNHQLLMIDGLLTQEASNHFELGASGIAAILRLF